MAQQLGRERLESRSILGPSEAAKVEMCVVGLVQVIFALRRVWINTVKVLIEHAPPFLHSLTSKRLKVLFRLWLIEDWAQLQRAEFQLSVLAVPDQVAQDGCSASLPPFPATPFHYTQMLPSRWH